MKINVGHSKYELSLLSTKKLKEKYEDDNGDINNIYDIAGYHKRFENEIYINSDYSNQVKKQSFWHELLHALTCEIGDCDLSNDERRIEGLSLQLYAFFENNKLDKIYDFVSK